MIGFVDLFGTSHRPALLVSWRSWAVSSAWSWLRRFKDWAMIILAGLIGGLLVTRGLTIWLPFLQGVAGTLLVLVLAGASIVYQANLKNRR